MFKKKSNKFEKLQIIRETLEKMNKEEIVLTLKTEFQDSSLAFIDGNHGNDEGKTQLYLLLMFILGS